MVLILRPRPLTSRRTRWNVPQATPAEKRTLPAAVKSSVVIASNAGEKREELSFGSSGSAAHHLQSEFDGEVDERCRDRFALGTELLPDLIESLLPRYRGALRVARTSLRPVQVESRAVSWRKDDSRLHVDAFPSRPNHGERILRVFHNPGPAPRVWRLGEPFEDLAKHFYPEMTPPLPGASWLLQKLGITKLRRSEYDHRMLQLHDRMKADSNYQRHAEQQRVEFPAGSTWICFSDQTAHAAISGQNLLEQTLHLPVSALYEPMRSPLRVLERLAGHALV